MTNELSCQFASGFEALGLSTRSVLSSSITSLEALELEIKTNNTALFVSLSGLGMDMRSENNAFHKFNIPFFLMLLDQPLHYWDKVEIPLGLDAISTLSEADKNFILKYSNQKRKVFKLSHAGTPKIPETWANKDIELIYFGTLRENPTAQRKSWSNFGSLVEKRLNTILEEHLAKEGASLIEATTRVLSQEFDCSRAMLLHPYYVTLDLYLRDYHRVETLRTICSAPLTLGGEGWDSVLAEFKDADIRYLGRIHPNEVGAYYARAKIVLNIMNTYHESHERVFSAMADGSVALTSTSEFYRTAFDVNEIILFDWQHNNLNENCREMLANDSMLKEIAINGHQAFLKKHTWRHRAELVSNELGLL